MSTLRGNKKTARKKKLRNALKVRPIAAASIGLLGAEAD